MGAMDYAMMAGIPLAMRGAYEMPTDDDTEEMNKYLAEQDKRADKFRDLYGRGFITTPPNFLYPEYAAQGGRAGYAHGNLVDDEEETLRASALASLPEYALFSDRRRNAKGGRIGYAGGSGGFEIDIGGNLIYIPKGSIGKFGLKDEIYHGSKGDVLREDIISHLHPGGASYAQGGRIGAQEGGLMNLGGMEKDYRQEGGFVPIGGQEKADDVPAR